MNLNQLSIINFTSLREVTLDNIPDLVILIGKNSSGKSNLLDAIALFMLQFGSSVEQRLGSQDEYQHLFPENNVEVTPPPSLLARIYLRHEEAAHILGFDDMSNDEEEREQYASLLEIDASNISEAEPVELLAEKSLIANGSSVTWKTTYLKFGPYLICASGPIVIDGEEIDIPEDIAEQIPGVDRNSFMVRLDEFFKSQFQIVHTTENPRSWTNRFTERPTIIDPDHVQALWSLHQSRGIQRRPWAEVSRLFETVAPNEQRPVGVANSIQLEEGSLTIPVGMVGEGSQAVLRLIDKIQRSSGIVAVEEPETHLHPGLAKRVGQLLSAEASDSKQIFLTTHSGFLIDRESLDRCFLVNKSESGTSVAAMGDKEDLRAALLDIGVRPSDVLFSDAILVVEGYSDERFYSALSNLLGVPLVCRHVKIICSHGKDRGKYKIKLWSELASDAELPLYVILDQDASDQAEEAISDGSLESDRCLVLSKGDLEDYYPWEVLRQTLEDEFGLSVESPIPVGERVAKIRSRLGHRTERGNSWKPVLADGVASRLNRKVAESEFEEIADFLRKMSRELESS